MANYNPKMPSATYDKADMTAILASSIPQGLVSENLRFDSAEDASIFFARELDYVKKETYDVEYPEFTGLKLFPISHEVNEGAETVTYYSYEKTGFAKIISNYATDLPRADVKGKPTTVPVKSIGDSYGYSMQDMRASRMAGKSLDTRRGEAAKYQIDRKTNEIIWAGDAATGLPGVLTASNNVPTYTLATVGGKTTFADKTVDEIAADLNGMRAFIAKTTKNVEVPDTVVLPPSVVIQLAGKRVDGTAETAWDFVKKAVPGIKNWEQAPELESDMTDTNPYAAASGGRGVCLMYKKDAKKLTIEVPLAFYQYAAQPKGLEIEVPCEARVAGAIIYYPMSLLIAAGV